ncbi:class I SAM-dependent methyltransferase [Oceaniglobus roseus]|uniref:class I SAM-dependent methyltransferase n=1 Tax=Oceaniglobus roseus TaxID=1737570 RepID=UPI000C7EB4F9|nr:class I SAM-dependent methyltransferase [Kandeliimicrobium roseum]
MNALKESGHFTEVRQASPCRLCGAPLHHTVVDLGMSPPCESFLPPELVDAAEVYHPLHVMVCEGCMLVQLRDYVQPEEIFTEYAYFSSFSTSWVEHARRYAVMVTERFKLDDTSFVVELASNDGYLLQHFGPLGVPVLGIEPAANVAAAAVRKGIPTRVEFFGTAMADRMRAEGQSVDLVIGNNVLAQVPDLNDFVEGVARLLKPEGVATFEFPHVGRLLAESQFDTIYHEHYSYFSLTTIEHMAARHGMYVFDVERLPTHGGSLRVYLAREGAAHAPTANLDEMRRIEREEGLDGLAAYRAFDEKVRRTKRELLKFLIEAKDAGRRICGYGAPGKGNTLLNYCGIGTDFLDFTVDRNPYKHGRFTPGMRIPIRPVEAIDAARPDHILILPWNLRDEIVDQMRHVADWGGTFVVPIPRLEIITPERMKP